VAVSIAKSTTAKIAHRVLATMMLTLCRVAALLSVLAHGFALALPALPALHADPAFTTISGISSGADLASHVAVALSDLIIGSAIFAGEPWGCAIQRFPGEPEYPCAAKVGGSVGPGCVGGGFPGSASCLGCSPGSTLSYDHCKMDAAKQPPVLVNPGVLVSAAINASLNGLIPPTSHLARSRTLCFRGDEDVVYLPGSVNKTCDFFRAFADSDEQVKMVVGWPMQHALPTIDPALNASSCGGKGLPNFPAMANCGYDGAGESLAHMLGPKVTLTPPPSHACDAQCASRLVAFDQTLYTPPGWQGRELSSVGWLYVPTGCSGGDARGCKLHISLHGCGMSMWGGMGLNYITHSGYNPWGEANNISILYVQGGGFIERNQTSQAPAAQIGAGCFDGYGQTRADYAFTTGPQIATIRNMILALTG
jgi:hypothetical protein